MTLTRELRTTIAFALAMVLVLTAFVWGNQRQVHADSLAEDILCWIDTTDGVHPPVPFFFDEECDGGEGPVVPPPPQCFDGIDNDNDGKTDWSPNVGDGDPGCDTPTDNDESDDPNQPPAAQCSDGIDNDADGLVDFPADPGCTDGDDTTESPNPSGNGPACSDGIDNDQDGLIDMADPGCSSPSDTDETNGGGGGSPACSDGTDNDSDGLVDFPADPGCSDAEDTDEANGGGGGTPQCSDGIDNDNDGDVDMQDPACDTPTDNDESDDPSSGKGGGSSHHHHSGGSSNSNNSGEVLGAETECPMYLTGYIKYGANNDAGEVAKLQAFLNNFEGNALPITGTYGPQTLAAVNAFQAKYAQEVLAPWGLKGTTGYVYYTTQKQINTIYCKFQKDFPLTASQIEEIAYVRQIQPTLRAQGITSTNAGTVQGAMVAKPASAGIGSVVLPATKDENADATTTQSGANASTTKGWFGKFIDWLFGR